VTVSTDLAFLLGLPPAAVAAQQHGLRPPSPQIEHAKGTMEMISRDPNPSLL
jgi:hypothetical protein